MRTLHAEATQCAILSDFFCDTQIDTVIDEKYSSNRKCDGQHFESFVHKRISDRLVICLNLSIVDLKFETQIPQRIAISQIRHYVVDSFRIKFIFFDSHENRPRIIVVITLLITDLFSRAQRRVADQISTSGRQILNKSGNDKSLFCILRLRAAPDRQRNAIPNLVCSLSIGINSLFNTDFIGLRRKSPLCQFKPENRRDVTF